MYSVHKKQGFSLAELLVVISIIGLLSSVIIVSVSNARQNSRDKVRIVDIEQLRLTLLGLLVLMHLVLYRPIPLTIAPIHTNTTARMIVMEVPKRWCMQQQWKPAAWQMRTLFVVLPAEQNIFKYWDDKNYVP